MQSELSPSQRLVADALSRLNFVRVGLVFGSIAEQTESVESDVDLAVAGDFKLTANQKLEVMDSVAAVTGRPVDVVDLLADGGTILRRAITTGRMLVLHDKTLWGRIINRMLLHEADFMPYVHRINEERRRRWIGI